MISFGKSSRAPYLKIWKIEDKGNYAIVQCSTGRKDPKNEGKYINSSWYTRFVGKAYEKVGSISSKDRVLVLSGGMSNEPYTDKEGKTVYPQKYQIVIFDFEVVGQSNGGRDFDTPPQVYDENDIPF